MKHTISKEDARKALHDLNAEHVRKASELLAIINAPEPMGLWKPKKGEVYWTVYSDGDAFEAVAHGVPARISAHGLVFHAQEIAQKAAPLLARSNKGIAAAFQADEEAGEWAEDRRWTVWSDSGVLKSTAPCFADGRQAYVHTREQAEEMRRILIAEGLGK